MAEEVGMCEMSFSRKEEVLDLSMEEDVDEKKRNDRL